MLPKTLKIIRIRKMDNKPLEKQAQSFIISQLIKFDFKVNELSFDEKGSDLYIIKQSKKHHLKYLTIQCKGRKLNDKNTSVRIPISYVENNFILFIYTIDDEKNENLFLFFPEQIKEWKINTKNEYSVSINKERIKQIDFQEKIFNRQLAYKIDELLKDVKEYTSIFIDGIFLEKSIDWAYKTYSKIWPEKKLKKPDLIDVINNILEFYNRYKTEKKIINCTLFLSSSFSLEQRINIDYENLKFQTKNGNQVRILINKTNEIIAFEICEELDRLIDNDNIVLVASDQIYEHELSQLKSKGYDMIIVRSNYHDGSDMYSEFRWGDVTLAIGLAFGLERHEL
ncbi:hypothetical protein B0A68_12025 [Flavobacterium reichenbachii]|uniref:DUF4365 domain-containing protein n=2 Tax=Flavobacterium reichenbachii TaxID=362418 RepID=A0A085ZNI7_9FLAO|nr:hypothetical protein IW19_10910 [Flavobacterium reichenbachii]OXB14772.1 hypothetical protein B0A68_12025 [Flavobacterium reichenbachii]